MIVVDTSALVAILLAEPVGSVCATSILDAEEALISAGTMAEALIVAERKGVRPDMLRLIEGLGLEVVPVTSSMARDVGDAYARWGKGLHPAGLNCGDCFAYALASQRGCPILFVGDDFARTDARSALAR